ncbi:Nuclear pore complex protein Nup50 [Frankliniella fusca]|uniref:Nuclear pore complex protein Nup50 n=1 Tax=Frankliniella fusca TaxID=407009 RepID=A0AAE1GRI1_9NEOP|nr:Nuclear pore complex protein Nup50 [Frankliniella fusca]
MAKRTATTELNHDNWCEEDEPEAAGVFKRASEDALKGRQIRTAKRRGVVPAVGDSDAPEEQEQSASKSVFAGFTGFKKAEPASTKGLFSFLATTPNGSSSKNDAVSTGKATDSQPAVSSESEKKSVNGIDSVSEPSEKSNSDKEYYRKLKGLNESVSKWISSHVSSNPLILLTPIFRDYERHLANIQGKGDSKQESSSSQEESTSISKVNKGSALSGLPVNSSGTETISDKPSEEKKTFSTSIFGAGGSATAATSSTTSTFSFGSSSAQGQQQFHFGSPTTSTTSGSTPTFSFGSTTSTSPSAGFSFGSGKPFTFSNVASNAEEKKDDDDDEADEDTPPKPDHKPVNEEGATYTKRCKVFIKQGKEYSDRGIGNLFLKPVDGGKTQLIVRADTSLGNILLNTLVSSSLPVQRMGINNVVLACIPTPDSQPPPVPVLIRVKTSDDADELFSNLEKHKKEAT